jgi:predicted small integral membrane protein
MIRISKIILVAIIGLQGLFYALNNIANWVAAKSFVAGVLPMEGHLAYPEAFGPAISSPALHTAALILIVAMELSIALLAGKGIMDMVGARKSDTHTFQRAKLFGLLACCMTMFVWFGLFKVIGEAYFQMWQTDLGGAAASGAFHYGAMGALIAIFVQQPDTVET